jgi:plastocyanin
MKKVIGLLILIIVLVAVSGCTQQTKTAPVTTAIPTTVETTEATTVATPAPTTEVPVATTEVLVATTEVPAATTEVTNATAPAETTMVPTVTQTVSASMTPSTKVTVVHIVNNTFTPSVLMVLPGTGITWANDDNAIHSVKMIGDHKGMFNSGDIASGGKWGFTFSQNEGTYVYADGYNTNVTGTIIVKAGDVLYGGPTVLATATPATTS